MRKNFKIKSGSTGMGWMGKGGGGAGRVQEYLVEGGGTRRPCRFLTIQLNSYVIQL